MILAAQTNVAPWKNETPLLAYIDALLQKKRCTLFTLPWKKYTYVDGDHFTERSFYSEFVPDLAEELKDLIADEEELPDEILLISDSTIDWFGKEGKLAVEVEIAQKLGKKCMVDAISGSGFCAMTEENSHFRGRLSTHLRKATRVPLLVLIGGWNDVHDSRFNEETLTLAIDSTIDLYQRFFRIRN